MAGVKEEVESLGDDADPPPSGWLVATAVRSTNATFTRTLASRLIRDAI
jgi:hypothetical protein